MSNRIEQRIDELEQYIESCKFKPFSSDIILVNKEEIDELIRELRLQTPEEIKRYQKLISNREAILEEARAKAEALINDATAQTTQLISEHQIMQQAYAQANEIIELATKQAQEILDSATIEANSVKSAAMQYTDDNLAFLENVIKHSIAAATEDYTKLLNDLTQIEDVVVSNRASLNQTEDEAVTTAIIEDTEAKLDVI